MLATVFPTSAGRSCDELRQLLGPVAIAAERASAEIDAFRALQDESGAVVGNLEAATLLLDSILDSVTQACNGLGQEHFARALAADIANWKTTGIDRAPKFDRTRDAYVPPASGGPTLFAGPVLATNGPAPRGYFFELFLAWREEPHECDIISQKWPHPKNKCQSTRLITSSHGFSRGNCIVFFPENIAASTALTGQQYALFFFNKFHLIYNAQTMPEVKRLLDLNGSTSMKESWASAELNEASCYNARCVWGYLHDYFHHAGPRPFDEQLHVKLNWFAGLLEEIKVDAQTALLCMEGDVPYGEAVLEFILFERMFRYPQQPDASRNFDSATGVLLYEWLRGCEAITSTPSGSLTIDRPKLSAGLESLVREVLALESDPNDTRYKSRAKDFVRRFLPESEVGARFSTPRRFNEEVGIAPRDELLDFSSLGY